MSADIIKLLNTPERRAESARVQAEAREEFGHRLAHHPAQANYVYSMGREQLALDQLQVIADEENGQDDDAARRTALYNQLAEGYALQGRFNDAAAICIDARLEEEYREKAAAMTAIGDHLCDCPETTTIPSATDAKGQTIRTHTRISEVWDAKGKQVVAFFRCGKCGCVSAKGGE